MTRRTRSLLGTIGIIVVTIAYPLAVVVLFGDALAALHPGISIPIFAVLGALWCLPMMVLIRWMARPD